jgi:hypothetical protein
MCGWILGSSFLALLVHRATALSNQPTGIGAFHVRADPRSNRGLVLLEIETQFCPTCEEQKPITTMYVDKEDETAVSPS